MHPNFKGTSTMALRAPTAPFQACCCVGLSRSFSSSVVAVLASSLQQALLSPPPLSSLSPNRPFSTSTSRHRRTAPVLKQRMQDWFKRRGNQFKLHTGGKVAYLQSAAEGAPHRPFPSNPVFISQPVLSESARELIWEKVMVECEGVKAVSAELSVDQKRVAAVVRMKQIEKEWIRKGSKLAKHYSKAVLEMVPTHNFDPKPREAFEPINEIHVHGYTMQQLFVPTSESRFFTREDAAKAFHDRMLSPDKRVPHPELVEMERRVKSGWKRKDSWEEFTQQAKESEQARDQQILDQAARAEMETTKIKTPRFEFRIKKMQSDDVGKHGRSRLGVGWRYGNPFDDRKRGQVKIPTTID